MTIERQVDSPSATVAEKEPKNAVRSDSQASIDQRAAGAGGSLRSQIDGVLLIAGIILAAAFFWAYWPTLAGLVGAWNTEPDYSHGFFVAPLAIWFLWARRDLFPYRTEKGTGTVVIGGLSENPTVPGRRSQSPFPPTTGRGFMWDAVFGLGLIAFSLAMRALGSHYYLDAIDGWSILPWVGGVVLLLAGRKVFWWSLPSIAFLWFMVPLPYRVERWLSLPLQGAATKFSCWTLQALGQPALSEGHTILLGDNRLEVEQACSGLRIFMGITALAFAYVILMRRSWWEKALLLCCTIPIALIANASRIVATGLLYQYASGEAARKFSHDAAGWVMIVFAAGLFGLVLWYLSRLVQEVEVVDVGDLMRRDRW